MHINLSVAGRDKTQKNWTNQILLHQCEYCHHSFEEFWFISFGFAIQKAVYFYFTSLLGHPQQLKWYWIIISCSLPSLLPPSTKTPNSTGASEILTPYRKSTGIRTTQLCFNVICAIFADVWIEINRANRSAHFHLCGSLLNTGRNFHWINPRSMWLTSKSQFIPFCLHTLRVYVDSVKRWTYTAHTVRHKNTHTHTYTSDTTA